MKNNELVSEVERTTGMLLQTIQGLTDAQLTYKINPQVWSIHQCLEHIVITEIAVYRILMKEPATNSGVTTAEKIGKEKIEKLMLDRSRKTESPDEVKPIGRFDSIEELKEKFKGNRDRIIEALKNDSIIFDSQIIVHPSLGEMTKKDWLHFMIHHCDRHNKQIEEIKSFAQLQMI